MGKGRIILFIAEVILTICTLQAQNIVLNSSTHNTVQYTCSGYLYDNSMSGAYSANQDRWVTICPPQGSGSNRRVQLRFDEFDIASGDKVYIYQGTSISSPIMTTDDNVPYFTGHYLQGRTVMPSLMVNSGCLTVRLQTDANTQGQGFKATIECTALCQHPEAVLDTVFYVKNGGQPIPHNMKRGTDTIVLENGHEQIVDYKSIDICFGDTLIVKAKPLFPENDNSYHQSADRCRYYWSFGDGNTRTVNFDTTVSHFYSQVNGYDLSYSLEDTTNGGCRSNNFESYRVRIAKNPIREFASPTLCSNQEGEFTIGYDQSNDLRVDSSIFLSNVRERYENTVFIPDGPNCRSLSQSGCYNAPVVFDQFSPGATITSVDDIVAVCINMEHTYLGDLGFSIICPNGQSAILKHNTHAGGADLGIASSSTSCSSACLAQCNPQGIGWTYCFSNQLLTNSRGVITGVGASRVDSTNTVAQTGYFQTPMQSTSSSSNRETVDLNGFAGLVGCPLNGEWSIMVCDDWGADNGYVFWWDLNLTQSMSASINWDYNVPIDTIVFNAPSFFNMQTSQRAEISPGIGDAGNYPFSVSLTDDFGCTWNDVSSIHILPSPTTTIDASICQGQTYNQHGFNASSSGTYTRTTASNQGCDSTIVLHLNVNPLYSDTISATICQGETYNQFGFNTSVAGFHTQYLQSIHGCDSIVTLDLTILPTYRDTITAEICDDEVYAQFGFNTSEAGYHTQTLQSMHGCDSVIVLNLLVHPTYNDTITAEICDNEVYTQFGFNTSEAGYHTQTLQSIHGCDSLVTLNLLVYPTFNDTIMAEICDNETYTQFGFNTSEAGYHTQTLQSIHGCDSLVTLNLLVHPTYNDTITAEICDNEVYTQFGFNTAIPGTHTQYLRSIHGCDSIVTLNLLVHPTYNDTITAEICDNEVYTQFGFNVSEQGVYTQHLQSIHGCDSIVTLNLIVHPIFIDTIMAEICYNEVYNQNGFDTYVAGYHTQHLQSIHGCDSIIVLNLSVRPLFRDSITAEICDNEVYNQYGFTTSVAGIHTQYLRSIYGCDSIVTLNLVVHPTYNDTIAAEICDNETYTQFGFNTSEAGYHTQHLQSIHGCDSLVTLNLIVHPTFNDTIAAEICDNETYTQFGFNTSEAGYHTQTLQSIHGCDSLVTLNLFVHPTYNDTITAEICDNEVYTQFGFNTSEAGYHTQTLQSIYGCDSLVTLNLLVHPTYNDTITAEICDNEVYTQFGFNVSEQGVYTQHLQSIHGCDSLVTLNLLVHPTYNDTITAEICDNEVYTQFGFNTSEAGYHTQTLQSIHGCDSLVTLNLLVHPTYNDTIMAEICDNETYTQFGFNTSEAGYHTQYLQSIHGCDSLVTLNLFVHPTFNDTIAAEICDNETYTQFGFNVSEQGVYTQHLQSIHGCDSLVTLNLLVHPTYNDTITAEICDNEVYTQFGFNTSEAGYHTLNLQSINGCDSLVTLNLLVHPTYNDTITAEICDNETYTQFGFNVSEQGVYTQHLQSIHGCDSLVTLDLTILPTYRDTITAEICDDEVYAQFGFNTSEAGYHTQTLQRENGCDSVIVLNLLVHPTFNDTIVAGICDNETYTQFGFNVSEQGVYTQHLQSIHGCDSLVTLNLLVHPTYNDTIAAEICDNETYTQFGFNVSEQGVYTQHLQSIHGCDSLVTLDLTILPTYRDTITAEICDDEVYAQFGFNTSEAGYHTQTLQRKNGCDSVIVLQLLVHPTYNDTITAGICDNETYTQFGFNVSEQGVYTQYLQSIHGCDSLVTLNLLVHPTYNDTIAAEICDNEVYTQFGFNTSEAGFHTQYLQSTHGCDSLVTLNLTVYPTFTDTTHVEICQGDRYQRDGFSAETTGIYVQNLQTTHGCDSVLVLDLVVFPTYLDTIIAETCEGIPYEQNGFYADRTGIYKQFLQTINGCDSTVVLNLRVNPIYNQDIEADICEDETYSFAGGTYSTQGVYEIRLQTEKGCDSLINLHLNVHSKYEQETDRRICQGETYIDRNFHESESGTYKAYYQSIWGCDSVIVLNLEVAPVYTDTIKAEIEYGQFYNDNGFFENERGSYVQYLTTEYGCDSIVVLWLEYLDRERKDIFAPNAITPQDEINNRFCVYPEDEEVIMEELVILNRNGAVIFSTKNFDECWNGKYKGEYVPQGVYKYMVVYHRVRTPDMKQRKIGSIMVMY